MTLRILPEALAELHGAATWLDEQDAGLGRALIAEYRERVAFARQMPAAGAFIGTTRGGGQVRRFALHRFHRYAILMVSRAEVHTVVAFEHSSRRPGAWRGRSDE